MLPNNTLLQGRYQIVEQIGRGGMGAVYKAIDVRLRATVALKQTLVEGGALSKAFEREAQLLASLRHPLLPRVSDHFIDKDGQFLIMEYIPGDDLGALLARRQRPFDVADVLRWADQLLDVLYYLHTHDPPVIHRDIKPQNIKLTDRNEIILLDFGLAKGSSLQTRATATGSIFGYTPHYAPLEQIHGTGTDGRSDLYSLAATLYHLMTGMMPVDAVTRAAAKVNDEPDPLMLASDVNPNVPPLVAALLQQAMSQKASERPPTAAVMRTALRQAIQSATLPPDRSRTVVDAPNDRATIDLAAPSLFTQSGATQPRFAATPPAATGPAPAQAAPSQPASSSVASVSPVRPASRRWIWAALVALLLVIGGVAAVFASNAGGLLSRPTPSSAPVAAAATAQSTSAPTAAPTLTEDPAQAAAATGTAGSLSSDATSTAIANIVNIVDLTRTAVGDSTATAAAQTEQASAQTEQAGVAAATDAAATQAALDAANAQAEQATAAAAAAAQQLHEQQTAAARPTRVPTPRPTPRPTRTPLPPTPVPAPQAECLIQGHGSKFVGSCSPGGRISGANGSCITGRVVAGDGSFFQTVLLSVDNKGHTIRVPLDGGAYDPNSGGYSICGLGAGEWGVTVINVNRGNGIEENPSQVPSQVIVRLSGADGERAVVSFRE